MPTAESQEARGQGFPGPPSRGVIGPVLCRRLFANRVEQFGDFDPRQHYKPVIEALEMNEAERAALGTASVDDILLQW